MIRGWGRGTDHYTLDGVGGIPILTLHAKLQHYEAQIHELNDSSQRDLKHEWIRNKLMFL